jgi:hypothetical protein
VGRGNRAYKSAKRNKELQRLKKREEKRQRRLGGKLKPEEEGEAAPAAESVEPEADLLAGLGIDSEDAVVPAPESDGSSDD